MCTLICAVLGLFVGILTGSIVNNFAYGFCEIGEMISWFSYLCFGIPIIGGIVNGIEFGLTCEIYTEDFDLLSVIPILWGFIKLVLKSALLGAAIAAAAFLISFVSVIIQSGGILAGVAVAVIITICASPVIVIYLK